MLSTTLNAFGRPGGPQRLLPRTPLGDERVLCRRPGLGRGLCCRSRSSRLVFPALSLATNPPSLAHSPSKCFTPLASHRHLVSAAHTSQNSLHPSAAASSRPPNPPPAPPPKPPGADAAKVLRSFSHLKDSVVAAASMVSSSLSGPWLKASPDPDRPSWSNAVANAEALVHSRPGSVINPSELLGSDLALLTQNIRKLLGTGHPVLATISSYYFSSKGKHIRPLIVLLMAQATSIAPKQPRPPNPAQPPSMSMDTPLGDPEITFINDGSPPEPLGHDPLSAVESPHLPHILPSQRRLAEITEMIHTASLLHDDVIDESPQRRSAPSANAAHGNKMAVLGGDFLLARASVALARLRNVEVVELLATVISHLVEGEFMQLRNTALAAPTPRGDAPPASVPWAPGAAEPRFLATFDYYMAKTYYKTAALMAKSCKAAAVLSAGAPAVAAAAHAYGKNLGLAFQLVDDMLDFTQAPPPRVGAAALAAALGPAAVLGKPTGADLKLGLATAPVLFAAQQVPELWVLIERKFAAAGDVDQARSWVLASDGIEKTRRLAGEYSQRALDAVAILPASPAREALMELTRSVLTRTR